MNAILPNVSRVAVHVPAMVLLAIVVVLLAATRLGDVTAGGLAGGPRPAAGAATVSSVPARSDSAFLRTPFVSPFARVLVPWAQALR